MRTSDWPLMHMVQIAPATKDELLELVNSILLHLDMFLARL